MYKDVILLCDVARRRGSITLCGARAPPPPPIRTDVRNRLGPTNRASSRGSNEQSPGAFASSQNTFFHSLLSFSFALVEHRPSSSCISFSATHHIPCRLVFFVPHFSWIIHNINDCYQGQIGCKVVLEGHRVSHRLEGSIPWSPNERTG